uniref:Uncharacterized protein n=1 Tax=Anguilla anguilla TaxID=7936 RepID=A0A0E9WTI5_ANGAN
MPVWTLLQHRAHTCVDPATAQSTYLCGPFYSTEHKACVATAQSSDMQNIRTGLYKWGQDEQKILKLCIYLQSISLLQ